MNDISSMYDVALQKKLRFTSPKGALSLEQLWETPLTSRDDFNLDTIAKSANKSLIEVSAESFVKTEKSSKEIEMQMKLELIKHVIASKIAEKERLKARADNKKEREKLLAALEKKQDSKLQGLSEAALKKQLRELEEE